MNQYFSTFITGFDEVVGQTLIESLRDVKINLLTDGLVIYETTATPDEIKKIKFLNNSFILLRKFNKISPNPTHTIVKTLIKDKSLESSIKKHFSNKKLKFRIRASVENQFIAIDKNLLKSLEERITRSAPNLKVNRSLPDIEFLIATRSEGFGLIGIQFTHRANYEKVLEKGELYPELAHILCLISEPDKDDVFFDPFSGHGSIPAQRLNFPHKQIIAGEIDRNLQQKLEKKFGKRVNVGFANALSLSTFIDNSIDKIVTDPPWGLYDTNKNIPEFYSLMLEKFHRVIKPGGIIVILTAQKEIIEKQLDKFKSRLQLVAKYNTLVSGKKAGAYKLNKT